MNHLQFQTLAEMQRLIKGCSHIDLLVRINGENKMLEADFLKDLILSIPLLSPAGIREITADLDF